MKKIINGLLWSVATLLVLSVAVAVVAPLLITNALPLVVIALIGGILIAGYKIGEVLPIFKIK